jgi:ATP-dependent DNA helicase 2 subunit 1
MHMIYLPFQDDLRFPEEDLLLMKATPAPHRATPEQVTAAEQLIEQLTLEDFSCAKVPNPALANHYAVVEVGKVRGAKAMP